MSVALPNRAWITAHSGIGAGNSRYRRASVIPREDQTLFSGRRCPRPVEHGCPNSCRYRNITLSSLGPSTPYNGPFQIFGSSLTTGRRAPSSHNSATPARTAAVIKRRLVDDWAETATLLAINWLVKRRGWPGRLSPLGWAYMDAGRVVIGDHNVGAARMCDQGCCATVILRRRHRKPGFPESGRRLRGRLPPLGPSSNSLRLLFDTGCAPTPHARMR